MILPPESERDLQMSLPIQAETLCRMLQEAGPERNPARRLVPLVVWLTEELHPKRVVQIGLTQPEMLLAAARTMVATASGGECLALGFPSPDFRATVPGHVRLIEDALPQAIQSIPTGAVDLLLLDLGAKDISESVLGSLDVVLAPDAIVLAQGREADVALDGLGPDHSRTAVGRDAILMLPRPDPAQQGQARVTPPFSRLLQAFDRLGALLEAEAERHALTEALARRDAALAALRSDLEAQRRECDDLEAGTARRDRDIVDLTRRLEEARVGESETALIELEAMSNRVNSLLRERRRLLASTSWRVTAPVRRVVDLVRRLR